MKKILLVEDDPTILKLLEYLCVKQALAFQSTTNGVEALKLLQNSKDFQLVISDEFLPGLNGHRLAEWIRQDEGYCMTPFILISAENNPKMFGDLTARRLINFYVPKPFSISQFTAVLSLSLTTFTKKAPIPTKIDSQSKAIEPVKTGFPIH